MSLELWTKPLSGTAAAGDRTYPSQKGSVAVVVYPEEFSGSNATDRYRQGVNVRSIDDLYSYVGMKPQPINDLLKVRDGKIQFEETPFDDNESPINMGISTQTVYSGTIVYSSSFNTDATELNGLLGASIASSTIRFFRASDAAISKSDINGVYVDIEDAAVPHHQKLRFTFSSGQSFISRSGNNVTVGISAMNDNAGYPNAINSGSLAARLVQAINSASLNHPDGFAVGAQSGSIPASNFFTGTQQGQSDTLVIVQKDVGTLIASKSIFEGYDVRGGGGIKKGAGGSTVTVSSTTFMSASGFDGGRTILFLTNSSGLIGNRSLYTAGTVTDGSTHYVFTGPKDESRFFQSTKRYGRRGTNINLKYKLLKAPFNSTEGSTIQQGTVDSSTPTAVTGDTPELAEGIYLEVSNTGLANSWEMIAYHSSSDFTSGFATAVTSSISCWTGPKYFRFRQDKHSTTATTRYDNWALSELFVVENTRKQDSIQPLSERSRVVLDPTNSQSGVRSAPNHFWDDRDLGMTDVYQDGELFKDTATVNPVEIVIQDPLTIDIPAMMVDASDKGLMDGVLEPFPIRSVADRSNIQLPYTARGIKADMTLTDVYRKSDTISQEYRKRSVRSVKLQHPHKLHSGDSNYLIVPISSSLRHPLNYKQGTHLPTTGSAVQFFVPSYQIPPGSEFLTKDEILSGSTSVAKTGRHMTILLHNHPAAVITGVNPHQGAPGGAYNYRQIAIGPGYLAGYTNAQWNAGLTDAQIVSVAASLRDDIVDAINGTPNANVHRGEDTVSNFGIRAKALGGIVTGTLGGSAAKFFRIRLTATIPGKRGDDITISQVSGTDSNPGNELVNGIGTYNFAGGKGFVRQRRRHVLKGSDSYFDGVETFGLDILDDAERVKKRLLEVVIDQETGDKVPVEAYEDWAAMNISGTYGKSHLAPIQMQGFVAPSDAVVGAFDDASDTILRVRGIKDGGDLSRSLSYTTLLNAAFESLHATPYTAVTSSAPIYINTGGTTTSGTIATNPHVDYQKISPSYFSGSTTAMSNLISHHSFLGSTTPENRSGTTVNATLQGSYALQESSPFITSQGVSSVKVDAKAGMTFPTVLTLGPSQAYSGNRAKLREYYLRVTGTPSDTQIFTITDHHNKTHVFEFDTNDTITAAPLRHAVDISDASTTSERAEAIAKAINDSSIEVAAMSGSLSPLGSTNQDTIRLISQHGDLVPTDPSVAESLGSLTGSHGDYTSSAVASTKFSTGSVGHRDSAFSLSFWMKGDGDRNFYLAQSYCSDDADGSSNYASRNWNIRFTGYDYDDYSYQYMYFYLFDNDSYPTDYSFLYRRFYGHTLGDGFGCTKLVNALQDGNWHHFVISYDGDIDSTLTHNENIPKKKSIGKLKINTGDVDALHNKSFVLYDVLGNYQYFKFKNDNEDVTGRLCHGSSLYHNIGLQSMVSGSSADLIAQIARRTAHVINNVTTKSGNGGSLHVHAYANTTGSASYYASSGGANKINFGSSPAELSFNGTPGAEGDTTTNSGFASSVYTITGSGEVVLVQQYAGPPRSTTIRHNLSTDYFDATSFTGHAGVYYDHPSSFYIPVDPVIIDDKPHEHFRLFIDGKDVTETYASSNTNAISHYSAGSSGAGTRYQAMGKPMTASIEFGGLSKYTSWSASRAGIFVENPFAEISFYQGLLDTTSVRAIYEMSLVQDADMLSTQPMVAALMKSNVSAQDLLSRDHVSATAGYEYNNNVEVGTDSLAFGGLKK